VYEWAIRTVGLLPQHAETLRQQYVTGSVLLTLTEEKLFQILPLGPATLLAQAIEKLKILPGNYNEQNILYVANVINV
jgi:hypothetical protein